MLCPLPPASPSIPAPQATVPYNALRQPQTALPASLRFGNAKAPSSANPFVWLFNGIKSLYDLFSKTKVGQWVNRLLSKINQFLKAKPKENPKPASPTSSAATSPPTKPTPPSEPAVEPTTEAPPPPDASSPPPSPPVAKAPESPQPLITEPVASKPPFVPYSERSLEALQKKQAKFQILQSRFSREQAVLQKKLDLLEHQRAEQQTQLEHTLRQGPNELDALLIPDINLGLSILDGEIKTLSQGLAVLQDKQAAIQQRTPQLKYWIQFRKNLLAAQ